MHRPQGKACMVGVEQPLARTGNMERTRETVVTDEVTDNKEGIMPGSEALVRALTHVQSEVENCCRLRAERHYLIQNDPLPAVLKPDCRWVRT